MLRFSKKTKEESGEEDIGSIKKGIYMYFYVVNLSRFTKILDSAEMKKILEGII